MIFAKYLSPMVKQLLEDGTKKRQRSRRITTSEIMTIVVSIHISHYRYVKNDYLICVSHVYKEDFPYLRRYTQLIEDMPRVIIPICAYFTSLKGKYTDTEFIESTSMKVCHNTRIPRHKTFDGVAQRGKWTMS
jgi:hypothetical protein